MSDARRESASGLRAAIGAAALTLAVALIAALEPDVRAARERVDDARLTLRSDQVAFADAGRIEGERARLTHRFARTFAIDPQARVLHGLSATLARHRVTFSSTRNGALATPSTVGQREFEDVGLTVDVRGDYRGVLHVVDELARACELTRIDSASLHRAGDALNAHLTIALLRPASGARPGVPSGRNQP